MKKINKLLIFVLLIIFLTSCKKSEQYNLDESISLHGKIVINEVTKDGHTEKISVLELDKEINIDGVMIDKIELEYDKELKNNTETTITGKISSNEETGLTDLKFALSVDSVDNILSYVNSFSNDLFSIAIPANLMKETSVEKIENGFIINSRNKKEVFRIIALSNEEYKALPKDEINYEPVKSNKEKTVIIIYQDNADPDDTSIDALYQELDNIKKSIKIK